MRQKRAQNDHRVCLPSSKHSKRRSGAGWAGRSHRHLHARHRVRTMSGAISALCVPSSMFLMRTLRSATSLSTTNCSLSEVTRRTMMRQRIRGRLERTMGVDEGEASGSAEATRRVRAFLASLALRLCHHKRPSTAEQPLHVFVAATAATHQRHAQSCGPCRPLLSAFVARLSVFLKLSTWSLSLGAPAAMSLQALWRCADVLRSPFRPAGAWL